MPRWVEDTLLYNSLHPWNLNSDLISRLIIVSLPWVPIIYLYAITHDLVNYLWSDYFHFSPNTKGSSSLRYSRVRYEIYRLYNAELLTTVPRHVIWVWEEEWGVAPVYISIHPSRSRKFFGVCNVSNWRWLSVWSGVWNEKCNISTNIWRHYG